MSTPRGIKSLPQWAQDYIQELEASARDARAALDKYIDDATPTDIAVFENLTIGPEITTVKRYVTGHRIEIYGSGIQIDIKPGLPFTDEGKQ